MPPRVIPPDWPYRNASRHIACPPHLWHVQEMGTGPILLLIHGAGGATHSFRNLIPLLTGCYRIIVLDLPGQGFTTLGARSRCGLEAMAQDIAALCKQEHWDPYAVIGHSAGAAIALRLMQIRPAKAAVGINAALGKFEGAAGWVFPILARFLAVTPLVSQMFSKLVGTPRQVKRLLESTGSHIDAAGQAQYLYLMSQPNHLAGTLAMMSQWDVDGLMRSLPQQASPCLLITGSKDLAVPPDVSARVAAQRPDCQWSNVQGFGHLIHEEAAGVVSQLILSFLESCDQKEFTS
ncbi:MAG: alpha/beta fold hydrolase BchO [Paracoccaceae bacterium]